jgi:glucosyl-3-phosphoglycerate synthase
MYRNVPASRICQVELMDTYEHKHQCLSEDDPTKGLRRMTCDIAKSLFRTMAAEGIVLGKDHFRSLEVRYMRMAEDMIHCYYSDAIVNGLRFDRHGEELAVATFGKSLRQAANDFLEDPLGTPLIPSWNRVLSAVPDAARFLMETIPRANAQQAG